MRAGRGRWGWVGIALIVLLIAVFAWLNSAERAAVDLGLVVLYQLPLVAVILVAFLLGMLVMFLVGLRQDMRVRRVLRANGLLDPVAPTAPPPPPPGA